MSTIGEALEKATGMRTDCRLRTNEAWLFPVGIGFQPPSQPRAGCDCDACAEAARANQAPPETVAGITATEAAELRAIDGWLAEGVEVSKPTVQWVVKLAMRLGGV